MGSDDVITPRFTGWDFATRERRLFESAAKQIPTWRLANQSRRMLADVLRQLSDRLDGEGAVFGIADADSISTPHVRRMACLSLGMVAARGAGALIVLVSAGYEREALGSARTILEALIWIRAVVDQPDRQRAEQVLSGRMAGTKSLATRFGRDREVKLLDRFAHADVWSLRPLEATPGGLDIKPLRGQMRPAQLLYDTAYIMSEVTVSVCECFEVSLSMPGWIVTELRRYQQTPLPPPL